VVVLLQEIIIAWCWTCFGRWWRVGWISGHSKGTEDLQATSTIVLVGFLIMYPWGDCVQ
jgi:hypothetical protein